MSAFQTPQTDFAGMFWPQVFRGLAIMFCILPPTRMALGNLDIVRVPDASGLFNLMRNLGGAIGIALIDTVIYSRSPTHANEILTHLQSGDAATAKFVGIPISELASDMANPQSLAILHVYVEKAAMTAAINDAWLAISLITLLALICIPFVKRQRLL